MKTHTYRVYYQWQGRTHSNPFAREKSATQVADALKRVPIEFRQQLSDQDATVAAEAGSRPNEILMTVTSTVRDSEFLKALGATLQAWELLAEKVQ